MARLTNCNHVRTSHMLKKVFGGATGITAVLTQLREHPADAQVQENACKALAELARDAENQVTIARKDGIMLLLEALKTHPTHAGVVQQACLTLCNLANNAANQVTMAEDDGIPRLLQALQQHPTHEGVVEEA